MKKIIRAEFLMMVFCLFFVLSSLSAQPVRNYAEAEAQGAVMLKELKSENIARPMHYEILKGADSFKDQVREPNTIYEIKNVFDLHSETVVIPEHCILIFNGGSLKNGKVAGNGTKYCSNNGAGGLFQSESADEFERIEYIVKASAEGLVKNNTRQADGNYLKLKRIIQQGKNVYLDGKYYVRFSSPLILNRVFRFYGGEIVYEKNAFHFSNNGGLIAEGTAITASDRSRSSFFCGSSELLGSILVKEVSFLRSTIDCGYLVNILYRDMNSDQVSFGVNRIEVDHCVFKETGRFRVMDAVISEKCSFTNNDYQKFTTTPIYICCQHSVQNSPNDKSAYRYVSQNLLKGCPIKIDHNIFKGEPVSLNYYYCAALIKSVNCIFTNNYLQDIINYCDGKDKKDNSSATAYDAYLSCVNVDYENNFVKDMMSFSKNGGTKPQCQIGKSKSNPLDYVGMDARRIYRNNTFIVDGSKFLKMGAEPSSLYTDVFGNASYIKEYVWERNFLIYKKANLKTATAGKSYGVFRLENNVFVADEVTGTGLITLRSNEKMDQVVIKNNRFRVEKSQLYPLLNQRYKEGYKRENQKSIVISDNVFENSSPKLYFYTGEDIVIKNNKSGKSDISGNMYLTNYSGSGTFLDVKRMDAEIGFSKESKNTGGLMQYFSSNSKGKYSIDFDGVSDRGVSYFYALDQNHDFSITLSVNNGSSVRTIKIPFHYKRGNLTYEWEGKTVRVSNNTDSKVWYKGEGIQMKTSFYPSGKKQVVTRILPSGSSKGAKFKLTYESE